MANIPGLDRYKQRLASIPAAVQSAVKDQLHANAAELVAAIQRAAPVDERDPHPGALRDSVHWYPVAGRELSVRVIADAKDDKGETYAAHVEHGHETPGGGHVPAQPFFYPTYRARKKSMKRKLTAAARKAIKAL